MGGRDRFRLRRLVLGTAAAVAACSWRPTVPAVPSQGGHPWVELTTEHFMVWTDASAAQGQALAEDMEHLRQVLYGVAFFHPTSVSRCFVIALRTTGEVHAFVDWLHGAETWSTSPIMQPVIVLPIDDLHDEKGTVTHELTHAISYSAIPNQPRWFSEGLATYFETVRLNKRRTPLEVGRPNTLLLRVIWAQHLLSTDSLFACTRSSCTDARGYATAWALFAYLLNERPKQLQAYMQELAAGERAADPATWTAAFGKLTPADLDFAVADWVANGDLTVTSYRAQLRDLPIAQRGLGDADVYAARALLRLLHDPNGPVPEDVARALAVDPTNVVARMILDARGVPTPVALARRIVAAHPDDWRAWWIDAYAESGGPTARSARAAMCALVARNPANLPPGICVVAPSPPGGPPDDAWSAFWRAHDVSPAPPPTMFDPVPTSAQLAIVNLTHGAIDDATARRWVLGDIRRQNADAWTGRHLRLDIANAGILGPHGLNGTGRSIVERLAKGVAPADGPSAWPVIAAVIAIPHEARRSLLSDYAIVQAFRFDGHLSWQLDTGHYRDDPTIGGIWYQARGWTCHPAGSHTTDQLCALVARSATPVSPPVRSAGGSAQP